MQGFTVLTTGSHKLAPTPPRPAAARRISYPKNARSACPGGSGLTVPRGPGYCAATHTSPEENP
jgi:hypothetical protein